MSYRLSKITTRKGDEGFTSLAGERLSKDDLLIDVLGNVDELNSTIGLAISLPPQDEAITKCLTQVQQDLFDFGAEFHVRERLAITPEKTLWLEECLEAWNKTLPPLKEFILPRGNPATAATHLARTICRRTERSLVKLHRQVTLHNPEMLRYINRLSDLLFVIARILGKLNASTEIMWESDKLT